LGLCLALYEGQAAVLAGANDEETHQAGCLGAWSSEHRVAQLPAHGKCLGKEAGLKLEEVKTLLRHENLATTSEVYGDLGMEAKRRIQQRLVNFVKQQATRVQ
jgi:hypothetical protein